MRESLPIVLFVAFLAVIAQLITGLSNTALLLGVAALSAASVWLREFIPHGSLKSQWTFPLVLAASSAAAIALLHIYAPPVPALNWLAPLVSGGLALGVDRLRLLGSRRCALCRRRIGAQPAFSCPRCGLTVCDRTCWEFEHLRCRLCLQNEVSVFPLDARWWDQALGPRHRKEGHCQLCMTDGEQADLRMCRRCGRPQCRRCWDSWNGRCSRCSWVIESLPPRLAAFTSGVASPRDA